MSEFRIVRDSERCLVCLECIRACPQSQPGVDYPVIVESVDKHSPPEIANIDNCFQCLLCYDACRSMAITLINYHKVEAVLIDQALRLKAAKIF
ncbi:MAG: hypothetical protein JXA42_19240 [Anaerolineales bacterium]|nr:hypothetical protein [Anaerolineales bacterium]